MHKKPEELFRKLASGKPKQWEAVFKVSDKASVKDYVC